MQELEVVQRLNDSFANEIEDLVIDRLNETLAAEGEQAGMRFLRGVAFQISYAVELASSRDQLEPAHHVIDASVLFSLGAQLCEVADTYLTIAESVSRTEMV